MTVAGDYIGRVRLGVTIGVAGSQSFVWPDGRPAGTYTGDAGADGTIELTVTEVGGDGLTVSWAADASRRMIGHPWRLLRDGAWLFGDLYVVEAEPADLDPVEFTVLDGTVEVRVAMVAPAGPVDAGDVSVDVAGTPTPLDEYLASLGGGGATHTVAVFADDFDPTGSFTTIPLLPGGDTPRAYLTGADVLIVEGDHLGLWTIPASGAATAGTALAPADLIVAKSGWVAVAQTVDGSTVSGVLIQAGLPYVDAALAVPRAATDLWYATAADNPGPVIYDHGDRRAHATFTPGVGGNASATGVIPLTEGTWSVHPTHDLIDKDRPRIPDRSGLAFADGVRIMWRGKLGVLEGWHPHNGIGYMDVLCNQSIGDDGALDSLEPGLRHAYDSNGVPEDFDVPFVRGFVDSTPAGSTDLAGDEHQDYSDPLTVDQALSETHLFDYRFDSGERILDWYVPTPTGGTPDLTLPGEYVEDWSLHSTTTRTAPPGFYRSGLEWRLGDEPNALSFLKAWDLDTGDLEIDFDAAEVTTAGWTDSAGNEWDATAARVVEGPCIYVGRGTAYLEPVALNPGEGDWTLAWWAHHTDRIGTDGDGPGWAINPDPGGATFVLTDGTQGVDIPLGFSDDALHFVIVSVDRAEDVARITVDGELVAVEDISGIGDVAGATGLTLPDGHTLRYLSFQADALSIPELDDLYGDVVASFDPPATGGGVSLGETSTTAYRGDRGKTAYDHSQVTSGNPHGTTAAQAGADAAGSAAAAQAHAIQRANHTGTQAQSTIDNLATDLAAKTPTSRTITAGTGLTGGGNLTADRTLAVDAATLARIGTTVEATSDSTARTSNTYTADGVLQFEGAADTTYRIDAYLIFQGDAASDLKVGFTTPAGTMHLTVEGALTSVASGADYDRFLTLTSGGATTVVGIAGPSTPIAVRISGVIHLTSAGTVSFGWAPNGAAGSGVTRLARSQLYYRAA